MLFIFNVALVWREGPKYPFFNLLSKESNYVFTSVTLDAKKEEFHDEMRRLCDLHLFVPFLKLVESNISTKKENILNSQISKILNFKLYYFETEHCKVDSVSGVVLGIPVSKLDELDVNEVIEFRKDAINLCKEIVEKREESLEAHAIYAYAAQVAKTSHVSYQMFSGGTVVVCVWMDAIPVQIKMLKEAHPSTVINEVLESSWKKNGSRESMDGNSYVLKICARQEYLLGAFPISQYKVSEDLHFIILLVLYTCVNFFLQFSHLLHFYSYKNSLFSHSYCCI